MWLTFSAQFVGFFAFCCIWAVGRFRLMLFFITTNTMGKASHSLLRTIIDDIQKNGSTRDWASETADTWVGKADILASRPPHGSWRFSRLISIYRLHHV
jgi:hypothetical protein